MADYGELKDGKIISVKLREGQRQRVWLAAAMRNQKVADFLREIIANAVQKVLGEETDGH